MNEKRKKQLFGTSIHLWYLVVFSAKIQTFKIAKNHHYSLPQMLKTSAVHLSLSHGSKGGSIDPFCGLALSFFTTSVLIIMSHLLSIVLLQNHCNKAKPSKKDNGSINRRIDDLRKVKLRGFWLLFWLTCKSILKQCQEEDLKCHNLEWFILCQHIWY